MVDGIVAIPLPGQPLDPDGDQNPRSALRQFLAGPENRLVETAVRSVLDGPPNGYNPLVFYGAGGTGKSHLARGLATEWKACYRRRRVEYTTAVDFARELADAVETQAIDDLRTRYRKAVLLIFEDIGLLAGKPEAQEELVHTFDALLAVGRRIVVTALVAPAQSSELMPALQSRLASGLAVPLAPPGPETRRAILQRLAELRKIRLSEPVAGILAGGLCMTVPELFRVLVQLEIPGRPEGNTIDADAAHNYLAERSRLRQPRLRDIAAMTARFFSLRLSDLRGRSRRRAVATARGVAMYLARHLTPKSLEQIGHYFGGRDHTTVMHGCRKTEHLLKHDPAICQAVQQLQQKWRNT